MYQPHAIVARLVSSIERLMCRLHLATQRRRDLAELARLSRYELRDIGLSHPDSAPIRQGCCS
jgi:uncharacterized protein YjiS (DUF1127 family)